MPKQRRLLCPEVIQASTMDCGPAALAAVAKGYGINASYGRLREACRTGLDGTSIDDLEVAAAQLGLSAEQVLQPLDHLFDPRSHSLPCVLAMGESDGIHFIVAWRSVGSRVQIMNPASGRRWVKQTDLLRRVLVHRQAIDVESWMQWAQTEEFSGVLTGRMRRLGLRSAAARREVDHALSDNTGLAIAALDAATRVVEMLVRSDRSLTRTERAQMLRHLARRAVETGAQNDSDSMIVPADLWTALPLLTESGEIEGFEVQGAVMLRIDGVTSADTSAQEDGPPPVRAAPAEDARPWREAWKLARDSGAVSLASLVVGAVLAALVFFLQALLLRGLIDLGQMLAPSLQRWGAVVFIGSALAIIPLLHFGLGGGLRRLGRRLDLGARVALARKLPTLEDGFFQSRLVSDIAERAHSLWRLRDIPQLLADSVRVLTLLLLTVGGITWLDPRSALPAVIAAVLAIAVPIVATRWIGELDLRVRTQSGTMSRFFLDALLGLSPLRTHNAGSALRIEFNALLVDWGRSARALVRSLVTVDGVQTVLGFALASWVLGRQFSKGDSLGAALLLVYWSLSLPQLGEELAQIIVSLPQQRNVLLRLLEPLNADATPMVEARVSSGSPRPGVEVQLQSASVMAGGQSILENISLQVGAGEHVAIVGSSGAGKSSLVRLLLGLTETSTGHVVVDGKTLDAGVLQELRQQTAWVDPEVQLWNRSLLDNLLYSSPHNQGRRIGEVLDDADLREVLPRLSNGLQSSLGHGGGHLSGGEGQRVRLARAFMRERARLVVLDEAFRGLDRSTRKRLQNTARARSSEATLFCVTHDIESTTDFDRVLVVEGGRVVEDGHPLELRGDTSSRYFALLSSDLGARHSLWTGKLWRRYRLEQGQLHVNTAPDGPGTPATKAGAVHGIAREGTL